MPNDIRVFTAVLDVSRTPWLDRDSFTYITSALFKYLLLCFLKIRYSNQRPRRSDFACWLVALGNVCGEGLRYTFLDGAEELESSQICQASVRHYRCEELYLHATIAVIYSQWPRFHKISSRKAPGPTCEYIEFHAGLAKTYRSPSTTSICIFDYGPRISKRGGYPHMERMHEARLEKSRQ